MGSAKNGVNALLVLVYMCDNVFASGSCRMLLLTTCLGVASTLRSFATAEDGLAQTEAIPTVERGERNDCHVAFTPFILRSTTENGRNDRKNSL